MLSVMTWGTVQFIWRKKIQAEKIWNKTKVGRLSCLLKGMQTKLTWSFFIRFLQSRLAINSVTAGEYNRPVRISNFIQELNAGFRLLNLKNDSLRKRFDGLKYDIKKVEEVVYDISIRGLKTSATVPGHGGEETPKSTGVEWSCKNLGSTGYLPTVYKYGL